jgi:hypothetical protein
MSSADQVMLELSLLQGDCGQYDPELWFADKRHRSDQRFAKGVCSGCPELRACQGKILDYELETNQTLFGIYGGLTEEERRRIRHKEKRA